MLASLAAELLDMRVIELARSIYERGSEFESAATANHLVALLPDSNISAFFQMRQTRSILLGTSSLIY